jgi:hypothetical protein
VFGSVFHFGDVFESVFDTGDVLGNSIFTHDVFESGLCDVNKQLVCNLVILIDCNYFKCDVFGSMFYFGDVLGSAFVTGDVYGFHKNRLLSLKH